MTNQQFAEAAKNGNLASLKAGLEAGLDVNHLPQGGRTALHKACDRYKAPPEQVAATVKLLLEHGANPELYDKGTDGPLHYAAMYGYPKAVRWLVEHGADINRHGAYGRTALIYAASSGGSVEMVRHLLENGAKVNAKNKAKENALFEMCTQESGLPEIAQLLIDYKINVKYKNPHYGTALHWAVFCGRPQIVKVLLDNGMDVNAKDKDKTPAITKAFADERVDIVKMMLEHGADPDSQTQFGWTLLEFAAESGDQDLVRRVIKRKKELQRPIPQNTEALMKAAMRGDLKMVELLIKSGVSVDRGQGKASALVKAALYGKLDVVKYLLNKGADIKAHGYDGNTALICAASSNHIQIVKELLKRGADVSECNSTNWTALMQACLEGHLKMAELLLEAGSPIDTVDAEKGATALTLAQFSKNKRLIALLEAAGGKERPLERRREGEAYHSIFDCGICEFLFHRKDLARTMNPEEFKGLTTIHREDSSPDRYADKSDFIHKCDNCGTYYHQSHSVDTEDAFIGGPSIWQRFARYNLLHLRQALEHLGLTGELQEAEARYGGLIKECLSRIKADGNTIKARILPYAYENLMDYFIMENDWASIEEHLLRHRDHQIALAVAKDLILMYSKERAISGIYPYLNYRPGTEVTKPVAKALVQKHKQALKNHIAERANSDDENTRRQAERVLETGVFYKLWN